MNCGEPGGSCTGCLWLERVNQKVCFTVYLLEASLHCVGSTALDTEVVTWFDFVPLSAVLV